MSQTEPLVSVIMIFLNAAMYMQEAVESVFAQTYKHWELVLVDDGSTDGSTEMALQYAAQHPDKVRYVQHPEHQNRGMSASRNAGVRAAKGAYITFLDADDIYLPHRLERQAPLLSQNPRVAIVYGATLKWYSWTNRPEDQALDAAREVGLPPGTLIEAGVLPALFLQRKAKTPATCSVTIRREAFEAIGGFDERFRGMFEDHVFFYKLLFRYAALVEGSVSDYYRKHADSHSHVMERSGEHHPALEPNPSYYRFLSWLEAFLAEQNINDPQLRTRLNQELWPYKHPRLYQTRRAGRRLLGFGRALARRAIKI